MRNRSELEQYRDREREALFPGRKFYFIPRNGVILDVIASSFIGWEHVSMVVIKSDWNTRQPTYDEMVFVKGLFWNEHEICIEVHPKKSEYVNIHSDCLHLWKSVDEDYKEMSQIIKEFITAFPKNTSSTIHVTHLKMYDKSYCVVTGPNRWPTWNELCDIKKQYFWHEEAAVQYHFNKAIDLNSKFIVVIASAPSKIPSAFQV